MPAFLAALAFTATSASAQVGSPAKGMNTAMVKLFGENNNFTSKAEVHVLDAAGKETTSMPANFALSGDKMRMDIDMTQIKSAEIPAGAIASMKQMGMDQMSTVSLPEKKISLLIYPSLKAYAEMPMSKEEAADALKTYKIAKTKIGKETIDGHPTDKNKVVMTDEKGQKQEMTVWNATDLKDFPVQMQMTEDKNTVVLKYKDIKFGKPDASKFEAPAGMTKYTDPKQLIQTEMMKKMNSGGAGGLGVPQKK